MGLKEDLEKRTHAPEHHYFDVPAFVLEVAQLSGTEVAATIDAPGVVKVISGLPYDAAKWKAAWSEWLSGQVLADATYGQSIEGGGEAPLVPQPVHVTRDAQGRWQLSTNTYGAIICLVEVPGENKRVNCGRNAALLAGARAAGVKWTLANHVES